MDSGYRRCTSCGEARPETGEFFYRARSRFVDRPDGWQSYCISCTRARNTRVKQEMKLRGLQDG
jgi:hypothetical protein